MRRDLVGDLQDLDTGTQLGSGRNITDGIRVRRHALQDLGVRADLVESVCASVRDQPGDVDVLVNEAVRRIAPLATADERVELKQAARAQMAGLGALDSLVTDPEVDEVLVNGDDIWVDRRGRLEAAGQLRNTTVEQ